MITARAGWPERREVRNPKAIAKTSRRAANFAVASSVRTVLIIEGQRRRAGPDTVGSIPLGASRIGSHGDLLERRETISRQNLIYSEKFNKARTLLRRGASRGQTRDGSEHTPQRIQAFPRISEIIRALTGRMTPFSVMMPAMSSAGVTSKAGL